MSTTTESSPGRVTVNCPACRAVNPDADANTRCSNCGEPVGVAVFQHLADEIKTITERAKGLTAPSFNTFNGFGTTLLDYREREDGAWEATRWVVAAMFPIVPLGTYVIRPERQQNSYHRMQFYFDVLGRVPLSPARILRVYALMILGLAPVVLGFMNSSRVNRTLGGPLAALAMLASVAWGAYIIFFRVRNDSKAYKPSRPDAPPTSRHLRRDET
jgi:hypothetical protein